MLMGTTEPHHPLNLNKMTPMTSPNAELKPYTQPTRSQYNNGTTQVQKVAVARR